MISVLSKPPDMPRKCPVTSRVAMIGTTVWAVLEGREVERCTLVQNHFVRSSDEASVNTLISDAECAICRPRLSCTGAGNLLIAIEVFAFILGLSAKAVCDTTCAGRYLLFPRKKR